jgi:hypothetical protein
LGEPLFERNENIMSDTIKIVLIISVILALVFISIYFNVKKKKRILPEKFDNINELISKLKADLKKDGFVKIALEKEETLSKLAIAIILISFIAIALTAFYIIEKDNFLIILPYILIVLGIFAVIVTIALIYDRNTVDDVSEFIMTENTLEINCFKNPTANYNIKDIHLKYLIAKRDNTHHDFSDLRYFYIYIKEFNKVNKYILSTTTEENDKWIAFVVLINSLSDNSQDYMKIIKESQK